MEDDSGFLKDEGSTESDCRRSCIVALDEDAVQSVLCISLKSSCPPRSTLSMDALVVCMGAFLTWSRTPASLSMLSSSVLGDGAIAADVVAGNRGGVMRRVD